MSAERIKLGGDVKVTTLRLPYRSEDMLFGRLEWATQIVKDAPAGTKAFLMSPLDLSDLNKIFYSRIRFARREDFERFSEMESKLIGINFMCSAAVARGWVVCIREE